VKTFTFDALPGRVVFGVGSLARLPHEVEQLTKEHVLVMADPTTREIADEAAESLGPRFAGLFSDIKLHVPVEAVADARKAAESASADCLVTIGGGTTTGFGKAVALEAGLPLIAVPTTYAGSEMTPIYGVTSNGMKRTGRDLRVLPKVVLYDPALTTSVPPEVTGPSGMNALAHCVEALYGKEVNPITSLMAEEAIGALVRGIPASVRDPEDLDARSDALYGAYLAGAALAVVGMALHHRICHVLGGTYGLAHSEVNAVILPHAARFNQPAAPDALARVARAMGADDAASGLFDLAVSIGAPTSLAALGMRREDLEEAARLAADPPPWNPRPVSSTEVLALLEDAFEGRRPDLVAVRQRG
jgi:maleylacetate reductase